MDFQSFISQFDHENSIVLLEGKRVVLPEDIERLVQLGKAIATQTRKMRFRSGNADGADYYFSLGVSEVDKSRMEVIVPYTGHRKKANLAADTISLDDINISDEENVVYQSKSNKKTENLIDLYVSGSRGRLAKKASYIIRDTIKVIGAYNIPPASFGIFYDDLKNPETGGTGHTMKVCAENNIPIIDQQTWFQWIEG